MTNENIWHGTKVEKVVPDAHITQKDLDKAMQQYEEHYHCPVRMRFVWQGKIYEGTAYYVGDAKEEQV